jgi:hypothetical protein
MSFTFQALPTATFPSPTSPVAKDLQVKAVKLTFADFTTGGTASVKAYLPADASIVGVRYWTKTAFSGNGVTVVSLQVGITGTVAKYLGATTVSLTANVAGVATALAGAYSEYDPTAPGGDIPLLFTGTATTGNPTAGEAYVLIEYVR